MPARQRLDFQAINITVDGVAGTIHAFQAPENAFFIDAYMTSDTNLRIVLVDERGSKLANRRVIILREDSSTVEEIGGKIARVDFGLAQGPPDPINTDVFYVFEIDNQKRNPFF